MEQTGCGVLPAVMQRDQTVTKILHFVQFASGPTFEVPSTSEGVPSFMQQVPYNSNMLFSIIQCLVCSHAHSKLDNKTQKYVSNYTSTLVIYKQESDPNRHATDRNSCNTRPHLHTGLVAADAAPPASDTLPSSSDTQMGTSSCLMHTLVSLHLHPWLMHSQNDKSNVGSCQGQVHTLHQSHSECHGMLH